MGFGSGWRSERKLSGPGTDRRFQKAYYRCYGKEKRVPVSAYLQLESYFTQERTKFTPIEAMQYVLSTVMLTAEGVICRQVKDQRAAGA